MHRFAVGDWVVGVTKQTCERVAFECGETYFQLSADQWLDQYYNDVDETNLELMYKEYVSELKKRVDNASTAEIAQMITDFRNGKAI